MATKSAENPAVVDSAAAEVVRTKRVIIQRPADNRDIGIYLGFNSVGSVYPFDVPVELPADNMMRAPYVTRDPVSALRIIFHALAAPNPLFASLPDAKLTK